MDDLIAEFVAETEDSLGDLDVQLVRLEQSPDDKQILGNIFRIMHTIKGTCGFLGLMRLATVAHASENILDKIRHGEMPATPAAISLILESLDRIKSLISSLQELGTEPEGDDKELIVRLANFCDSQEAHGGAGIEAHSQESSVSTEAGAESAEDAYIPDPLQALFDAAPGPDDDFPVPTLEEISDKTEAAAEESISAEAKESAIQEALNLPVAKAPAPAAKAPVEGGDASADKQGGHAAPNAGGGLIRVNLSVLESLMQMVSELVLTRNQLLQLMRTREDEQLAGPMQRLNYITSELQDSVMKTRMQPISNAWTKFPRLVRDLAVELGKKIDLRMEGEETELDRQVLEMIKDPLTHMVRNSADHGLETPDKRRAAGKPETGTINLRAYHEGGHIIIEITDDGAGIAIDRVKEKCLSNGLATESQLEQMTDQQIVQHIFMPGFSTAEKVTSVSGRGVGMDVVRSNIEKIGGTVEVRTRSGKGSTFLIKIPLTLAIVSVLIVESAKGRFAVPQLNVNEIVRVAPNAEYEIEKLNDIPVLRLREQLLPVLYLDKLLGSPSSSSADRDHGFVTVCKIGGQRLGLMVDKVYDTEEIVVKPMSPALRNIPLYSGSTILGDGSVVLIIDPNTLVRQLGLVGEMKNEAMNHEEAKYLAQEKTSRFLIFMAADEMPKAVSLDLVSRLEEIEASDVQTVSGATVLQYRGGLMRLITLHDGYSIPTEGILEVIVFQYGEHAVGLYIEEIRDIVDFVYEIKMPSKAEWSLGSTIIHGETAEVVDVGYLISQAMFQATAMDVDEYKPDTTHSPRVLLVEDSPFFIQLVVPVLESAGYQVTALSNAKKALKLLQKEKFDLIVTDIEMPEMGGLEFALLVREIPGLEQLPIVAFTSKTERNIGEIAKQSGIYAIISKTDREGLLRSMRECLPESEGVYLS